MPGRCHSYVHAEFMVLHFGVQYSHDNGTLVRQNIHVYWNLSCNIHFQVLGSSGKEYSYLCYWINKGTFRQDVDQGQEMMLNCN